MTAQLGFICIRSYCAKLVFASSTHFVMYYLRKETTKSIEEIRFSPFLDHAQIRIVVFSSVNQETLRKPKINYMITVHT